MTLALFSPHQYPDGGRPVLSGGQRYSPSVHRFGDTGEGSSHAASAVLANRRLGRPERCSRIRCRQRSAEGDRSAPPEAAACIAFRSGSTWLGGDAEETCYRDKEAARDAETRRNFAIGFTILAGVVTLVVRSGQSTDADNTATRADEPTPGATDAASERLQRLHDLHEQGVISDEEYSGQRQRVLDEL